MPTIIICLKSLDIVQESVIIKFPWTIKILKMVAILGCITELSDKDFMEPVTMEMPLLILIHAILEKKKYV